MSGPLLLGAAVAACFSPTSSALPVGPVISAGQASIVQQGKTLTITNTPGAVLDWQRFSIGQGETTRFQQQSAASSVLNRVLGQDPSVILGRLESNGRVFLINPNGITFGAESQIDVGGLVASSLSISEADFQSGRMRFSGSRAAGVLNQGQISTASGGKVWLLGSQVENQGLITSPQGEIILAAGQKLEMADVRFPNVRVQVEAPDGAAVNVGRLVAASGGIGVFGRAVRLSGEISANAAVVEDGRVVFKRTQSALPFAEPGGVVVLRASDTLTVDRGSRVSANGATAGAIELAAGGDLTLKADVEVSANGIDGGRIDVRSEFGVLESAALLEARGSDGPGGRIALLAPRVGLLTRSRTDASGDMGGGTINVGGSRQGLGPLPNSGSVYVDPDAVVAADAERTGNGGSVIVYSTDATRAYGAITARGGRVNGDGGFIETSGMQLLDVSRTPEASAVAGRAGSWLIDPNNLQITASTTANVATSPVPGVTTYATSNDTSQLSAATVNAALNAGTSVVIQTTASGSNTQAGNITFGTGAALTKNSGATDTSLTLQAHNDITLTQAITASGASTGKLNVTLIADSDNSGAGSVVLNSAITTLGGNFSASGTSVSSNSSGTVSTVGRAGGDGGSIGITATPTGAVNLGGALTSSGGTAAASSAGRNAGGVTISGGTVSVVGITASGSAAATGSGAVGGNAGAVTLDATGGSPVVTLGGAIAAAGGNGVGAAGGTGGAITVRDAAVLNAATVTLNTAGGTGTSAGTGGDVQLQSTVDSSSGARRALAVTAGTGALTVSGAMGGTTPLGAVSLTAGSISAGSINTTGPGTGGAGAAVTLNATAGNAAVGAITSSGTTAAGAGFAGGAVTLTGRTVNVNGAITSSGSNAVSGAGGAGGAIAITANDPGAPTLTLGANLTASGGTGAGGAGGASGAITLTGPVILGSNVTIESIRGTGTAAGASGAVSFSGATSTIDSDATARSLTVNAGAGTVNFGAGIG